MKTCDSSSNIVRELEMDDLREINVHQSWRDRLQSKIFIGYSNQSSFKSILIAIVSCFFFVVFTLCLIRMRHDLHHVSTESRRMIQITNDSMANLNDKIKNLLDEDEVYRRLLMANNGSLSKMREKISQFESYQRKTDQMEKKLATFHTDFQLSNESVAEIVDRVHNETIPVGFIYFQLPFQMEPLSIWDWAKWEQVTSNYSGHFFRAEGGGSEPFGYAQADSMQSHRVDAVSLESKKVESGSDRPALSVTTTNKVKPEADEGKTLRFTNETRPINYAIKIWRRTA
ncbi:uncharacterized protein LOC141853803 [Brevipalpus obovatus]|uniref:uncharacterized protein LOC141853803 n=1 Tax=Brevipalpus obovatus TaxID=246614 RepID=UPI003D9E6599